MMLLIVTACSVVSAGDGSVEVYAMLGRYRIYSSNDYFEDAVSSNVTGYLRSRYDICPRGDVEIENASIVLETPFAPGNFTYIQWDPEDNCTFGADEVDGNWTYAWNFSMLSHGQAMVSLPTIFEVEFDPGFDCQRIWDPWITSENVTQTLTFVFTPSTEFSNFGNVHVSAQIPETSEASPTIDPDSISASPLEDERGLNWTMWLETDGDIEVNWGGDPIPGITYTFSVDVTVENILFPEPIFYKPAVGFGANFATSFSDPDIPCPKIGDDINRDGDVESLITFNGTGAFTWIETALSENSVTLPWCSFGFHEIYSMAEGRALVRQENGIFRGPAHLRINKVPNTVRLSDPDNQHIFWWEVTEYQSKGNSIILRCIPTIPGPSGGDPGPTPIRVRITRFEEVGRVVAFGRGVQFAGQITGIEWPPP
jgi:hypothetical protein